eukprot:1795388-Amphidinium_carterae.1
MSGHLTGFAKPWRCSSPVLCQAERIQTKAKAKAREARMEARTASLCLMRSTANQLPRLRLRMNLPSCGNR